MHDRGRCRSADPAPILARFLRHAGKRFSLNHRFYVPKPEVIAGEWYAAPLVRAN
jgi:hypothetical protein